MSLTWREVPELVPRRPTPIGWVLTLVRGLLLLLLLGLGLAVMFMAQVVERPLSRSGRQWSPWITVGVCRSALPLLGLRVHVVGAPMRRPGVLACNHSSWLDIFVLNAQAPIVFVSKAEVAAWPGIGLLARATGTLFIRRESRSEAPRQAADLAERLRAGQMLAFFPEGTSSDNERLLPFKPALFAALLAPGLPPGICVQPVTLRYVAPSGQDPRFYAWWGDMAFGSHALAVLSARRRGQVTVTFHPPIPVAGHDRKTLAALAEAATRSALRDVSR